MEITISNEILDKLKCYWCGSDDLRVESSMVITEPIGYKVACRKCCMRGPIGNSPDKAIMNYFNGNAINKNSNLLEDISGLKSILIRKDDANGTTKI